MPTPYVLEAAKLLGFTLDNGRIQVEWDASYEAPMKHGTTLAEAKEVLSDFAWNTLSWSMRNGYLGLIRSVFVRAKFLYNTGKLDEAV